MTPAELAALQDPTQAFRLDGRRAVITGAGGGIGRQVAVTLAAAGATVVVADRDVEALEETVKAVAEAGGASVSVRTDVSDHDSVDALAAAALEGGPIDIWANVAGILLPGSIVKASDEDLELTLSVNLKGLMWGAAAAGRAMRANGSGSIINVSSSSAEMPAPGGGVYAMSKAAVISLTRTLAAELGPKVRVNAVAPGLVRTPMTATYFERDPEDRQPTGDLERMTTMVPLATHGEPIDIALAILFLASDASRYMTGQVLRPNGGLPMG